MTAKNQFIRSQKESDGRDFRENHYDKPEFKEQYENFIGGEWVAPAGGEYFDNDFACGRQVLPIARSKEADIEAGD